MSLFTVVYEPAISLLSFIFLSRSHSPFLFEKKSKKLKRISCHNDTKLATFYFTYLPKAIFLWRDVAFSISYRQYVYMYLCYLQKRKYAILKTLISLAFTFWFKNLWKWTLSLHLLFAPDGMKKIWANLKNSLLSFYRQFSMVQFSLPRNLRVHEKKCNML